MNYLIYIAVAIFVLWLMNEIFRFIPKLTILDKDTKKKKVFELFKDERQIQTTPKGIKIYGIKQSQEILNAIDAGATDQFEIFSECYGYKNKMKHSDWSIYILPSTLSPVNKTPSYNYPYPFADKGILVAGEYVFQLKLMKNIGVIAIAEPQGQIDFAKQVVKNELEHGVYDFNDQFRFYNTAVAGHQHPISEDCRLVAAIESKSDLQCGVRVKS